MNLQQIIVFRAVVETGSFSKAVEEQRLAQSAYSYCIKALCRSVSVIALPLALGTSIRFEPRRSPGVAIIGGPILSRLARGFKSVPIEEGGGRSWFRRISR
jgi:hypothetical protein